MVVNVYAIQVLMWWVCSVYVMVWLLVIDVIDVHIDLIPNGNMANVDAKKDILSMEYNV